MFCVSRHAPCLTIFFCLGAAFALETKENTTTTAPTPAPPFPVIPVYKVLDGTDICLLVQINPLFEIHYFNKKGESIPKNFNINQFPGVKSSGTCSQETESLVLQGPPSAGETDWSFSMQFKRLSSGHFELNNAEFKFTINEALFPDTNYTGSLTMVHNTPLFKCPLGSFFQCLASQTTKFTTTASDPQTATNIDVYLTMSMLKVEAFRSGPQPEFLGTMSECSADYVPDKVVPIVVGVGLASMIVIALITFIVSSRRRQRGYQTI